MGLIKQVLTTLRLGRLSIRGLLHLYIDREAKPRPDLRKRSSRLSRHVCADQCRLLLMFRPVVHSSSSARHLRFFSPQISHAVSRIHAYFPGIGAKSIRQDQQAGRHLTTVPLGHNVLVCNVINLLSILQTDSSQGF